MLINPTFSTLWQLLDSSDSGQSRSKNNHLLFELMFGILYVKRPAVNFVTTATLHQRITNSLLINEFVDSK